MTVNLSVSRARKPIVVRLVASSSPFNLLQLVFSSQVSCKVALLIVAGQSKSKKIMQSKSREICSRTSHLGTDREYKTTSLVGIKI